MKSKPKKVTLEEYKEAVNKWGEYKPPYLSSDIQSCVIAAKVILAYDGKPRRTKYEIDNNIKIDFSKAGKVTLYTHFPKNLGIKGKKLGEYPELQLTVARIITSDLASGAITNDTVHHAINLYEQDLKRKNANNKLAAGSLTTYLCRTQKLKAYFDKSDIFSEQKTADIIKILDRIIDSESGCYANELFPELKRLWKYAAPTLSDCKDVASFVSTDYVSSRVEQGKPCTLYTDMDNIVELWINMAFSPSVHQKNSVRFMILVGNRPMNINNLQWNWLDCEDYPKSIIFPKGAMKYKKSRFVLPITEGMRKIILEQKRWRDETYPSCSGKYIFLQPSDPFKPFATRSLDKLIKDYSPVDCILGDIEEANIKGTSGAFPTMCRKFVKSNMVGQLKMGGTPNRSAADISKLALHHKGYCEDNMADYYDFSEELYGQDFRVLKEAFELHEKSIMDHVDKVKKTPRKETGREQNRVLRKDENENRNDVRKLIKTKLGKKGYSSFINSKVFDVDATVKELILSSEGRGIIQKYFDKKL